MTIEQFNCTKWGAPEEEVFIIKFGKWKFADIYIPKRKIVVMVTTYQHLAG